MDLPAGTPDEPGLASASASYPEGTTVTGGGGAPGTEGKPLMVSSFTEWTTDYVNFGDAAQISACVFCAPEGASLIGGRAPRGAAPSGRSARAGLPSPG